MNTPLQYISFSDKARSGANSEIAALIIELLFKGKQSIKKWRNDKQLFQISWKDNLQKEHLSRPLNYIEISRYIRENGAFSPSHFNLPAFQCYWLDFSLDYKINWHLFDHTAPEGLLVADGISQQQYGKNYPIVPKLKREGHSFTTLQPQLLNRIMQLRNEVVNKSSLALEDRWFFDLRTLINDSVSIVEITLNQFYIKAEYDPLPGWNFDRQKLGERHGRRFDDKLGWVYKITGRHVNAENYMEGVNTLRELRNHMMHFDPPSLVISIEEATLWLNMIIDIGYLLIKVRQAIGVEVSVQLMNFILQKEAIFNPEPLFSKRLPLEKGKGDYATSTWNLSEGP